MSESFKLDIKLPEGYYLRTAILMEGAPTGLMPFILVGAQDFRGDFNEVVQRFTDEIEGHERIELEVFAKGLQTPVAGATIVRDYDLHVGDSIALQASYVLPEHRAKGIASCFLQYAEQLAEWSGLPWSCTKRIPDGYIIKYRGV